MSVSAIKITHSKITGAPDEGWTLDLAFDCVLHTEGPFITSLSIEDGLEAYVQSRIVIERQRHAEVMEEMRKALEPFAAESEWFEPDDGDDHKTVRGDLRVHHLRAARALLSRLEER